jgi:hypothetical protein
VASDIVQYVGTAFELIMTVLPLGEENPRNWMILFETVGKMEYATCHEARYRVWRRLYDTRLLPPTKWIVQISREQLSHQQKSPHLASKDSVSGDK